VCAYQDDYARAGVTAQPAVLPGRIVTPAFAGVQSARAGFPPSRE
jgi:hypothetical protein